MSPLPYGDKLKDLVSVAVITILKIFFNSLRLMIYLLDFTEVIGFEKSFEKIEI
jgi:hypothetical protein